MSRSVAGTGEPLRHRPRRAGPAISAAVVLLALGVFLVTITTARLSSGAWPQFLLGTRDWLAGLAWNSPETWLIGAVGTLAGILLILAAVVPGPHNALSVRLPGSLTEAAEPSGPEPELVMTRRGAARLACARCAAIDGVGSVTATASASRVHLLVDTPLHQTTELQARIEDEVREHLAAAGLEPPPKVTAAVRTRT